MPETQAPPSSRSYDMACMPLDARVAVLAELRGARIAVFRDAEAFSEITQCVERLGMLLSGKAGQLGTYEADLAALAANSPLASDVPNQWRAWLTPFGQRYKSTQYARNDAMHHGASARHLADSCIQLALILEDALISQSPPMKLVSDFMARDPVQARLWQPVAHARQLMLASSFSFLPLQGRDEKWYLLSDASVAAYLRAVPKKRPERLAQSIADAIGEQEHPLRLIDADQVRPATEIDDVIPKLAETNRPLLVIEQVEREQRLFGILTAFDSL